jgi:hypothetical protein
MARTCLKEKVQEIRGDEVLAFSLLQTAFAASALSGPAIGGMVYGTPLGFAWLPPWAAPQLIGFLLYVGAIIMTYFIMVETADLDVPSELRRQRSEGVIITNDRSMLYLFAMVAGHSFVFTGWEVGYPIMARKHIGGESWTPSMIGITFLVGSAGLFLHTLFTFPIAVKELGLGKIWWNSWVICIIVLMAFPRILNLMLALGLDRLSLGVYAANYVSQFFVSVSQGCNFTTLQLMLNQYIGQRPDGEYALPLANGWTASLQALARAISPVMTGTLTASPSVCYGVLAFDVLAIVSAVSCLVCGSFFLPALPPMPKRANALEASGRDDAYGYEILAA